MKAVRFLALSLPLLLCHSARRRVVIFFRSSANPAFSPSPACLNCRPSNLSSFRSLLILTYRLFGSPRPLACRCSFMPNLSVPMLTVIADIVRNF